MATTLLLYVQRFEQKRGRNDTNPCLSVEGQKTSTCTSRHEKQEQKSPVENERPRPRWKRRLRTKLSDYQNHRILFCLPSERPERAQKLGEREREAAEPFERCSLLGVVMVTPPPPRPPPHALRERRTTAGGACTFGPAHPLVNKELILMQRPDHSP